MKKIVNIFVMTISLPKICSYSFKIFSLSLFVFLSQTLQAQDDDSDGELRFVSYLSGSYTFGAQVYNSNFLFKPAYSFDFNHNYQLNDDLELGLGAGFLFFEDESFVPIYAEFLARKPKKRSDRFVKIDLGYSIANNSYIENNDAYQLKGGFMFRSGLGSIYPINDHLGLSFCFSYLHQFSELLYTSHNSETYGDVLNYSMFQVSLGLAIQ